MVYNATILSQRKREVFFILFLFIGITTNAQNLVVNGDFEAYSTCPTNASQLSNATGWSDASDTPDYLNNGSGCWYGAPFFPASTPYLGNGFGGFFSQLMPTLTSNNSERMYGSLSSNMIAGQTYTISFALKNDSLMSEHDAVFSDSLAVGIYLWNSATGTPPVLIPRTSTATIPQAYAIASSVGNTYTVYSFTHIATANYDSFVLGGFYIGTPYYVASTGAWFGKYFNVDNVSIVQMMPPSSQCDTVCGPNLAPNPGFENTTINCADTISEMFTNYSQVQSWFGIACNTCPGNGSTPDYYNSLCNGPAQTKNCGYSNGSIGYFSYALMGSNAREYVQAQLTSPLVAGMEYCVSINARSNTGSFAYDRNDGLGLWFTNQMVDIDLQNGGQQFMGPGSIINATPQVENPSGNIIDTTCQTISGTFIATGTEQWVVIGNFRNDASTTSAGDCSFLCTGYIIVDDISIRTSCNNAPQPPTIVINAIPDTICEGDCSTLTAVITNGTAPFIVTWDNGLPNGLGPHNVCPTINTTYTTIVTDSAGLSDTSSITIYVNPIDSTPLSTTICSNDSVFVGGAWQTSTGIYYDTLTNIFGCDSILSTTVTVNPQDTAAFSYPSGIYCLADPNPLPTITGTPGGTFIIDNSGVINSASGLIDLLGSGIGTFLITYVTNGTCPDTTTFNINIVSSTDATITQVGPFCSNDPSLNLSAISTGGTWTGTGITDSINGTFDPNTAGPGNHIISYTVSGACGDVDTITLVILPQDMAAFIYPAGIFCLADPNPLPTITGTPGGTFIIDNSGVINSVSGLIDLLGSGIGTFLVTYVTNGTCPDTTTFNINIVSSTDATITQVGPFCSNDPSLNLSAISPGGTWTGTGITNGATGTFDPTTAGAGTHVITYTIIGSCGDIDTMTIVVNLADDASFNFSSSTFCDTVPNQLPIGIITFGGTFTIDNGASINATTGEINISTIGLGTFVITYTTIGPCPDTGTFTIAITSCTLPTGGYTVSDDTICEGDCINFIDTSTGATSWQWTFNGGSPSTSTAQNPSNICFNSAGSFLIEQIVNNSNGSDTTIANIVVNVTPTIYAGPDVVIELGQSTILTATGTNGGLTWSPSTWLDCDTCVSPVSAPDETITYTVIVVDSNGCTATDQVTVIVDFDYVIWVPNIFSPNGDGHNDICFVRGLGVATLSFVVYDRWGEKVFETQDLDNGWDGTFRDKKMNNAVFVYYLKATFIDGAEVTQKGDITLIR